MKHTPLSFDEHHAPVSQCRDCSSGDSLLERPLEDIVAFLSGQRLGLWGQ